LLKGERTLPGTRLSLDDTRRPMEGCVEQHKNVRLNHAIASIALTREIV
jgi:hypothetical protein